MASATITADERLLSRVHYELIHGLIKNGRCPRNSELTASLKISNVQLEDALRKLSQIHGLVLHPHVPEPWVVHPFSLTPTMHWIKSRRRDWWAPCIWCALGVTQLVHSDAEIHSRIAGEAETLRIPVREGELRGFDDLWVHFAIPPAQAWQNVHQHCSMVLVFRSPEDIPNWCQRHDLPQGEAIPLSQVARLAQLWYGGYADVDWHRWTVREAQDIFREAGLISQFWGLGENRGKF